MVLGWLCGGHAGLRPRLEHQEHGFDKSNFCLESLPNMTGLPNHRCRDGVFHFDDYPLAPVVEESLCRATVVVDGQKLARFELHDKEALEDEVLEELVCKLVRNVRQFREHL